MRPELSTYSVQPAGLRRTPYATTPAVALLTSDWLELT